MQLVRRAEAQDVDQGQERKPTEPGKSAAGDFPMVLLPFGRLRLLVDLLVHMVNGNTSRKDLKNPEAQMAMVGRNSRFEFGLAVEFYARNLCCRTT
jgi:hypothetical protein